MARKKHDQACRKNKKWEKIEIRRVKLNPEQAVLLCCHFSSKDMRESISGRASQCPTTNMNDQYTGAPPFCGWCQAGFALEAAAFS